MFVWVDWVGWTGALGLGPEGNAHAMLVMMRCALMIRYLSMTSEAEQNCIPTVCFMIFHVGRTGCLGLCWRHRVLIDAKFGQTDTITWETGQTQKTTAESDRDQMSSEEHDKSEGTSRKRDTVAHAHRSHDRSRLAHQTTTHRLAHS